MSGGAYHGRAGEAHLALSVPLPRGLILGIETSNPSAWTAESPVRPGVALARMDGELARIDSEPVALDRPHDDDLVTAIERLMRRCGQRPRDLGALAVSVGPGGFTALRIAVTVAKMIAEATGALCIPVPSANAVARCATTPFPLGVALASKGENAWVTLFDTPTGPREPGAIRHANDLARLGVKSLIADRFLPASFTRVCVEHAIALAPPVFDALSVIECAADIDPVDPVVLEPLYPREPEAVTKWRERRSKADETRA